MSKPLIFNSGSRSCLHHSCTYCCFAWRGTLCDLSRLLVLRTHFAPYVRLQARPLQGNMNQELTSSVNDKFLQHSKKWYPTRWVLISFIRFGSLVLWCPDFDGRSRLLFIEAFRTRPASPKLNVCCCCCWWWGLWVFIPGGTTFPCRMHWASGPMNIYLSACWCWAFACEC